MLWSEGEFEAAGGLICEPSLGLLGDMCGVIIENQLDRRVGRIGGVENLEELDEFAAAVAVLDEGVNLPGEQINAGQQTDRAVALVLVIAREGRMPARLARRRKLQAVGYSGGNPLPREVNWGHGWLPRGAMVLW